MRTKFLHRYQEEWDALLNNRLTLEVGDDEPTNPLLLEVPSAYLAADYRVMIFGQETNGWEGVFPHDGGIVHMLQTYRTFYTSDQCYCYGGQFWNGTSKLIDALRAQLEPSGKTLAIMWNNLIKVGKADAKGLPSNAILDWENRWFDVVSFEVKELNPNLVVFFTGPNYDKFIVRIFDDAEFQGINERPKRQLARVKSLRLPVDSIRTYHPTYLWRHGFYEYLAEIVGAVRF